MFTINIHADIHIHGTPDAETLATIRRIEQKVDTLIAELVPGPAVDLGLTAGVPTEQPD